MTQILFFQVLAKDFHVVVCRRMPLRGRVSGVTNGSTELSAGSDGFTLRDGLNHLQHSPIGLVVSRLALADA